MNVLSEIIILLCEEFVHNNTIIDINTTFEDLGLDSLDTVELLIKIEAKFNITIPDDIYEGFINIKDYVNYLEGKINAV
jgi:acyl carrier protein